MQNLETARSLDGRFVPMLIEFTTPSSILREQDRPSPLRILGNGPPGTFVLLPNRLKVSLPTDQIVSADDACGCARVGFGGMRFTGMEQGQLVFVRAREILPLDQLSPARSHTMRLDPLWVAAIIVDGHRAWPREPSQVAPDWQPR